LFLPTKTVPEERTGRVLAEIERAEKIFRKMCGGEFEEEIRSAKNARQTAIAKRRIPR
jgi:hypothetical protein